MSKTLVIIDYGMGNLLSVKNAFNYLKQDVIIASDLDTIKSADAYILPGVGAFAQAMENLIKLNLINVLNDHVMVRRKPVLGICLGMQLFANSSEEMGHTLGLGWIPSKVVPIDSRHGLKVPHVGWNDLNIDNREPFLQNIDMNASYYFDHSYQMVCEKRYTLATCDYGEKVVAIVRDRNVVGAQFHPEKSENAGLRILRNYINMVKQC